MLKQDAKQDKQDFPDIPDHEWPDAPVMPIEYFEAKKGLDALTGEPPTRRRPLLIWQEQSTMLREKMRAMEFEHGLALKAKGFCSKCKRHIGRGRALHERRCGVV